ncbi:hypothetical protein B0E37_06309 [Streptomyces sp. MH192]|nr:hypothetical protein [Streptomyces sp. MH192]MCF0103741.1 hypothetical protein [Streptomyces sp. MH191]
MAAAAAHLAHGARRVPLRLRRRDRRLLLRLPRRPDPGGEHRRRQAEQRLPLRRRQPARPRRQGEPGERQALPDLRGGPARRPRRRGPRLLHRGRDRPQGDRPRRLEHRDRQGQAVRLHDHPAVREELLPGAGADGHPQGQGVLHLDQAGPGEEQAGDPQGLPQHQLLRPQLLRHPGRRAGLLRRRRQGPDRRAGRLPGRPPQRAQRVRRRRAPGEQGGREGPLELRPGRHGRQGLAEQVRACRGEVPPAEADRDRRRHVGAARLPRQGRQRLPGRAPHPRRGRPRRRRLPHHHHPAEAQAGRVRQGRRRPGDRQAGQEEPQGRQVRAGRRRLHRPRHRQGARDVRRHRLHEAVLQQRHPPGLPGRLHLQALRVHLGRGERRPHPGRRHDHPEHRVRRHGQAVRAGLERRGVRAGERGQRLLRQDLRAPGHRQVGELGVRADGGRRRPLRREEDGGRPRPAREHARPPALPLDRARHRHRQRPRHGRGVRHARQPRQARHVHARREDHQGGLGGGEAAGHGTQAGRRPDLGRHHHAGAAQRRPVRYGDRGAAGRPARGGQDRYGRGGPGRLVRGLHPRPRHGRRGDGPGPGHRRAQVAVRRDGHAPHQRRRPARADLGAVHQGGAEGQARQGLRPQAAARGRADRRPGRGDER